MAASSPLRSVQATIHPAPWVHAKPGKELAEAVAVLRGTWATAANDFAAKRYAAEQTGNRGPKGMQRELNAAIATAFEEAGWDGDAGRYVKGTAWVRVTFRHSMSQGADILDALRLCKKEAVDQALILAAPQDALRFISPNDAGGLCSYERLKGLIQSMDGALDIPLFYGKTEPASPLNPDVSRVVFGERPRDRTVPS